MYANIDLIKSLIKNLSEALGYEKISVELAKHKEKEKFRVVRMSFCLEEIETVGSFWRQCHNMERYLRYSVFDIDCEAGTEQNQVGFYYNIWQLSYVLQQEFGWSMAAQNTRIVIVNGQIYGGSKNSVQPYLFPGSAKFHTHPDLYLSSLIPSHNDYRALDPNEDGYLLTCMGLDTFGYSDIGIVDSVLGEYGWDENKINSLISGAFPGMWCRILTWQEMLNC